MCFLMFRLNDLMPVKSRAVFRTCTGEIGKVSRPRIQVRVRSMIFFVLEAANVVKEVGQPYGTITKIIVTDTDAPPLRLKFFIWSANDLSF